MTRPMLTALMTIGVLMGCGQETAGPAAEPTAATTPAPPAEPTPATPRPDAQPNPCDNPGVQTIELEAGKVKSTPWGLELSYAIDEHKKRGSGYMFLLRHGARRWETRRDQSNWTSPLTWRGFCWRGGPRPKKRASHLRIEIAPVCKDGKLVELGGCGDALPQAR